MCLVVLGLHMPLTAPEFTLHLYPCQEKRYHHPFPGFFLTLNHCFFAFPPKIFSVRYVLVHCVYPCSLLWLDLDLFITKPQGRRSLWIRLGAAS